MTKMLVGSVTTLLDSLEFVSSKGFKSCVLCCDTTPIVNHTAFETCKKLHVWVLLSKR